MKLFNVFTVAFILLLLQGCSLAQLEMEENPFEEQVPVEIEAMGLDDDADYAKRNHGIVNIHRHGPGYDVMLMLNAGESDIIFSMDLPPGGSTDSMSADDFLNGKKDSGSELNQVGKPGDPEEEKNFFNKKALGLFSIATKHMLSAQALFYRKSYWKALEQTNKAMSLVPASAQAHALKGSIYYKMGRKKDAKISWNNALKLDPSLKDVKESLKLVK
jgi:tetratricopeptide (TPR) repeat protein